MKTLWLIALLALPLLARGQGQINFANTSSTLILANGTPMPVSGTQQFFFAIFLAPATTVDTPNQSALFTDPAFQIARAYTTNSPTLEGRIVTRANLDGGQEPGVALDFVIRGWSANAGPTWAQALATWNNGAPLIPMFIGSSVIGNDILLGGGGTPVFTVFGTGQSQVPGFNMVGVPEPSSLALAGLGAVLLWRYRRRSP